MRQKFLIAISLLVFFLALGNVIIHAGVYNEAGGLVVMEMENGTSPLCGWELQSSPSLNGYSGTGYLEATSNPHTSGSAMSPREYYFKINSAGLYTLQLRCAKKTIGDRTDVANDCYVRVIGDYTAGPDSGDSHGDDAKLSLLKSNTKLYGGSNNQFTWSNINNSLDPGGHRNKRNARYQFKAGETYKLVVSERSGEFRIDRILFRKAGVSDTAAYNAPESAILDETPHPDLNVLVDGELRKWHKVTLTFSGPNKREDASDNPFLNYRLNVTFTKGDKSFKVPGYFAADGCAGYTSANRGNKWRVHFAPPETGEWQWTASFRQGPNVAVSLVDGAGSPTSFDGASGTIHIRATNKTGRDLRGKGLLQYVGEHYPRFAETQEYFLKQGADSPENMLAYQDFDGDFKTDGIDDHRIKTWGPHIKDWNTGDPTWTKNKKGKGLIGAINYLASEGMNVFSFLTMNIAGDDKNVFPYTRYQERRRIDCSKMDQWEVVFQHGTQQGFFLHFKLHETENDELLDGGVIKPSGKNVKTPGAAFGIERKFYYREMIARFGHHLALNWNLGEEWNALDSHGIGAVKDYCDYFEALDPYDHAVVIHTRPRPDELEVVYGPLLGYPTFDGPSIQTHRPNFSRVHGDVSMWVQRSAASGRKWLVACDEPGAAVLAILPDSERGDSHENGRKNALWGTFCGGGWGNEWYFGSTDDLGLQDFSSRDDWWDYCRHALDFWSGHDLPLTQMVNDNTVSNAADDYCYYKHGDTYVVYLKSGGTTDLDLGSVSGDFEIKWFDPRNGGSLQDGTRTTVTGGGWRTLGRAPNNRTSDWAILVRRVDEPTPTLRVTQLTLVNADTEADIRVLTNGDIINLVTDGSNLNIRADVEGAVESVRFALNSNQNYKTENEPVYAMAGNAMDDYLSWTPEAGTYTLKATPFAGDGATGEQGEYKQVNFTVVAGAPEPSFFAGINLNGPAITIGGEDWVSMGTAIENGLTLGTHRKETTTVTPIEGAGAEQMLKTYIMRRNNNLTLSYPLENGDYKVTIYAMQHLKSYESMFDVILEGATVATERGFAREDPLGLWQAFGPYIITVSDRQLNVMLGSYLTPRGDSDPQLMGLAIEASEE